MAEKILVLKRFQLGDAVGHYQKLSDAVLVILAKGSLGGLMAFQLVAMWVVWDRFALSALLDTLPALSSARKPQWEIKTGPI